MRAIKFRIYSHQHKLMSQPVELFGQFPWDLDFVFSSPDQPSGKLVLTAGQFVVMQYTGLKDKNGVEIYEGDIIDHFWGMKIEVKWDYLMLGQITPTVEVIGDIHENPELLP